VARGDRVGARHQLGRQPQRREQGGQRRGQGGALLVVERPAGGGGDAARPGQPAPHRHVHLHLEEREQEDRRPVHVGDDVVAIAPPLLVEGRLQRRQGRVPEGAGGGAEEAHLPAVVLGRHELLQVTEIVQREGQAVRVARISVGAGRAVVDQRHVAPAPALANEDLARAGDARRQLGGPPPARPGQEARGHRLGDAAHAPRGEHPERAARRQIRRRRARPLVPEAPPRAPHPLEQERRRFLGVVGVRRWRAMVHLVVIASSPRRPLPWRLHRPPRAEQPRVARNS
jgi:hypothetical protein